jgi:WD40 repeat protein
MDEDVPPSLYVLAGECLSKNPDERPESFVKIGDRLREIYLEVAGSSYSRRDIEDAALRVAGLNKKGISLYDMGMKEDALKTLEHAVKADPSHLYSSYNHTLLLWERGKMTDREVIRWLQMKAESHAGEWRPLYFLGLAHIARRDNEAAEEALREAIKTVATDGKVKVALEEVERVRDSWPHYLLTLKGHENSVNSVDISPDSRFALSGSDDRNLRYWDLITGECLYVLKGHERDIRSVDISLDGRFALSAGDDKNIRYWDLIMGDCLCTLEGHERALKSVAFSPDGRFALSGGDGKIIRYWDLAAEECLRMLNGHERAINDIAVSPDGRFALSGSDDRSVKYWGLDTGECLLTLEGHERAVSSVDISSDGAFALSGGDDRVIRCWDLKTGECTNTLAGHDDAIVGVAIIGDDRFAFSQGRDKTMRLWDLETGACLRTIDRHDRVGSSVAVSADGRFALSDSDDKDLCLWYLGGVEPLRLPLVVGQIDKTETQIAHATDFSVLKGRVEECIENRNWRGAAEYLHRVRAFPGYERHPEVMDLWNQIGLRGVRKTSNACWLKHVFRGHEDWVNSVAMSSDGRYAVSGSDDKTVRIWDMESGECLHVLSGHEDRISSVAVSPGSRYVISGGHDRALRLWDLRLGEGLSALEGHKNWVSSVAFSPDGKLALSGSDDQTIGLWDIKTGDRLREIEGCKSEVRSVAISPDGNAALSACDDGVLHMWDLKTKMCLHRFEGHDGWVSSVAISPDGRSALSGSLDNTLRLWDLRGGSCLRILEGHKDWIRAVAISPDGRFALSGGHNRNLRLWDLRTGECLHILKGHDDWISSVAFSPDGRYALSGSHDATLRLWEFDWGYEFPAEVDWAEAATPYIESFVVLHMPFDTDEVVRQGRPVWNEQDFAQLLHDLSLRGYGWLKQEGVGRKLDAITTAYEESGLVPNTVDTYSRPTLDMTEDPTALHCICCGQRFPASALSTAGFCGDCQKYTTRKRDGDEQGSWWKRLTGRSQV